jgi:hypothetical protein
MQATLSPALDFLVETRPAEGALEPAPHCSATASASRRRPVVTAATLQIAQQAATALLARTESPRVRLQRLAGRTLQYSAVFAAGLLVAFTLIEMRRGAGPGDRECTRHEAGGKNPARTSAEIRALQLSCARCHNQSDKLLHEEPSTKIQSSRRADDRWLQQLLREDSLVAMRGSIRPRAISVLG